MIYVKSAINCGNKKPKSLSDPMYCFILFCQLFAKKRIGDKVLIYITAQYPKRLEFDLHYLPHKIIDQHTKLCLDSYHIAVQKYLMNREILVDFLDFMKPIDILYWTKCNNCVTTCNQVIRRKSIRLRTALINKRATILSLGN